MRHDGSGTDRGDARAVELRDGELRIVSCPVPEPVADRVLVRVAAAGCNRADILQREGGYPAPAGAPAHIAGLEFAGEVVGRGPGVTHLRTGDRVMGITAGGAQCGYLLIAEDQCVPVPDSLDLVDAGAVPEAFFTAFEALVVQGGVRPGDRVLVNAVGSGVGTAVVQLATALGARVVGTTRSAHKLDGARRLGLHAGVALDGREEPDALVERLHDAAGGELDLAIDLLGGDHVPLAARALCVDGRVVVLGFLQDVVSTLDVRALVARRIRVIGTSLRGRPAHQKAALAERFTHEVVPLVAAGILRPVIDRVVDIDDAAAAYRSLELNENFGKVLLRPWR